MEIDNIEALLVPLLRQDFLQAGPRKVVQIGDKQMDFSATFKLYLCTRDSQLEIPPYTASLINCINFTVTKSGLEGQLLGITLNHEQPELEKRKTELLQREETFKVQVAEVEKKLLQELSNSEGNILYNEPLIKHLNETKQQSIEISESLRQSHDLQIQLDQEREVYRPLARLGSLIFMLFKDLLKINNMYQFSLTQFIQLFCKVLESEKKTATEIKLESLEETLIKLSYFYVARSLFKQDRLMFSLHFVKGVRNQMFEKNEWELFKSELVVSNEANIRLPVWAGQDRAREFSDLAAAFPRLVSTLQLESEGLWQQWQKSSQCEVDFPNQIRSKLSAFQRVLIIQALRPDRLESAINQFVCESLGIKSINPPPLNLFQFHEEETNASDPILFLVSPGADPTKELEEFASSQVGSQKFQQMAMGGGQNDVALQIIKEAAQKGEWVCLKNLHLVTSWLPSLEKTLKQIVPNPTFRLWLTSEPHHKFPSILLRSSIKYTYESPPGLKKNLQRTFQSLPHKYFEGQNSQQNAQLLFILGWFNAIVQERRSYIPQGWTKFYEFSIGDIRTGADLLIHLIQKGYQISKSWKTIHGLLESAVYGGRIDNEFDVRVLRSYLQQFFTTEVFEGRGKLSNLIQVPNSNQGFQNIINQLSDQETPNMFGLPMNIDRSVQRFNCLRLIRSLKTLASVSETQMKFDKEQWSLKLKPLWNLWQNLISQGKFKKPSMEDFEDPLQSFIAQECQLAFQTITIVQQSLQDLADVLEGQGLLKSKIEQEALCLLKEEVPETWTTFWEGPSTPNNWLRGLVRRFKALIEWYNKMKQQTLFQNPLDLSELFRPQTFLNVYRQQFARQNKQQMEQLKLIVSFEQGRIKGLILKNLLLQGGEFQGGRIIDAGQQSQELSQLPECYISWAPLDSQEQYQNTVQIPVYLNPEREKLWSTFNLPCVGNSIDKIISGIAICITTID